MATWNSDILNSWVAPGQADLMNVEIPDLRTEFPNIHELAPYHILRSVLFERYNEQFRYKILNYLFRNYAVFSFYHEARDVTYEFIRDRSPGDARIPLYMDAVRLWESCVHNVRIAMEIWSAAFGTKHFVNGSGSIEERMWRLANQIKHHHEGLASGSLWIDESGIRSEGWHVSFSEFADEVRALALAATTAAFPRTEFDT
jgi:hypothetical protein